MPNKFASSWLPPVLRTALNRAIGASIVYRGPFASWDAACIATSGYDEDAILLRIANATRQVLKGEARYEQDGSVFHDEPPASQALTGLMLAAGINQGRLSVIDFGGGLGSHFLRWRPILEHVPNLHWAIVEQAGFAAEGSKLFAAVPSISFHASLAQTASQPNAILASSVLQYLPDPYTTLQELAALHAEIIVLDRMPYGSKEAVVAQCVPTSLGKASYPVWVLSQEKVHGLLEPAYELVTKFDASDQPLRTSGIRATFHGSIWRLRT